MRYMPCRVCDIFLLLALLVVVGGGYAGFADDPGVGWHLKTGEWILRTGAVPREDPFLFSTVSRAWISDQWLSDIGLFLLFQAGGWAGLYGALTAVFLATYMVVGQVTSWRWSGSPLSAGIAALVALKLGTVHFILRPVLFGFLLFSVVCWFCFRVVAEVRQGRQVTMRSLAVLPPLFLVWSNLHSSFVVGFSLLVMTGISLLYEVVFSAGRVGSLRGFMGSLVLCAVCSLCNPYGFNLHRQIVGLGQSDYFMNLNSEWFPINMRSPEGTLFLFTSAVILAGAVAERRRERAWGLFEYVVFCAFFFCTARCIRFLPFFSLVTMPLVAMALSSIGGLLSGVGRGVIAPFARLCAWVDGRERGGGVLALCVSVVLCCAPWSSLIRGLFPPFLGPSEERYPYQAVLYLKGIAGKAESSTPVVVAASPDWGGFITWFGFPTVRAVIDDRNSLLGEELYKRVLVALRGDGHRVATFRELGATHILVGSGDPLARELKGVSDVQLVHEDGVASVFTW